MYVVCVFNMHPEPCFHVADVFAASAWIFPGFLRLIFPGFLRLIFAPFRRWLLLTNTGATCLPRYRENISILPSYKNDGIALWFSPTRIVSLVPPFLPLQEVKWWRLLQAVITVWFQYSKWAISPTASGRCSLPCPININTHTEENPLSSAWRDRDCSGVLLNNRAMDEVWMMLWENPDRAGVVWSVVLLMYFCFCVSILSDSFRDTCAHVTHRCPISLTIRSLGRGVTILLKLSVNGLKHQKKWSKDHVMLHGPGQCKHLSVRLLLLKCKMSAGLFLSFLFWAVPSEAAYSWEDYGGK